MSNMSVLKRAAILLLLLAAIGADAGPGPEDCHGLNVTLAPENLHTIAGQWVLIWSVSDTPEKLENMTSSHIEFNINVHNTTFTQRNRFSHTCVTYEISTAAVTDPEDNNPQPFRGTIDVNGVVSKFNDSANVDFVETCDGCLTMVLKGDDHKFLLSYRREGHHQDVEQHKAAHADLETLADCLGIPHDKPFIYDGAADFCHKKSSK